MWLVGLLHFGWSRVGLMENLRHGVLWPMREPHCVIHVGDTIHLNVEFGVSETLTSVVASMAYTHKDAVLVVFVGNMTVRHVLSDKQLHSI